MAKAGSQENPRTYENEASLKLSEEFKPKSQVANPDGSPNPEASPNPEQNGEKSKDSNFKTVRKTVDFEESNKAKKKVMAAIMADKNSHNPEDDPEYVCCWNFKIHFIVLIMAIFFGLCSFISAVERIYTSKVKQRERSNEMLYIGIMLFVTAVANAFLIVGNRLRVKQLYWVYFFLLMTSILFIIIFMDGYVKDTIDALVQDPRKFKTEQQAWAVYDWAVPRVLKAAFTYFVLILHVMISFYVYRDYCFVDAYPRNLKIKK
ncbi:unnamed protein product [Bursaphelenchus okinawaensis]|uniref:Uncharacterized protein n=1 Tax=Bursaphelenchus okinawaensis TaxID=465554 RepID=A0A811LKR0_9BILA|nr:unnamed protein product [Bursaphelenchus okinawaensis]CAG9124052.1 unnamed protein product [Bursaphelenchus okinawaensis]